MLHIHPGGGTSLQPDSMRGKMAFIFPVFFLFFPFCRPLQRISVTLTNTPLAPARAVVIRRWRRGRGLYVGGEGLHILQSLKFIA